MPAALAIAAHPDDIEFMMAGTLILLRRAGWDTHYLNIASGSCGSMQLNPAQTRQLRRTEAQRAATVLDAQWHRSFVDDLEIFYDLKLLRRLTAVVREVNPSVVLTHSPQDYMEDHSNTCRLAVTATFAKGFPNFKASPNRRAAPGEVTLYHAMPHGLSDSLRQPITPDFWIDTTQVQTQKRQALREHASQKEWLDQTQGMDSYVAVMGEFARALGQQSGQFEFAEGWRRHSHLGFCQKHADPLTEVLRPHCHFNPAPASIIRAKQ